MERISSDYVLPASAGATSASLSSPAGARLSAQVLSTTDLAMFAGLGIAPRAPYRCAYPAHNRRASVYRLRHPWRRREKHGLGSVSIL